MRKKESQLVTKESISATCGMFTLLALLVLCTRSLIFGSLGEAVHGFLTGVFGYCAYPLCLGALYLSVMGLFGKRLVKHRRIGWCVGFSLLCIALIVHTATTYKWSLDGYLTRCFEAGKTLNTVTIAGWFGGVVVFGVAKIATQLGALIFFILALGFCAYLTVIAVRRCRVLDEKAALETPEEKEEKATKKAKKERAPKEQKSTEQQPQTTQNTWQNQAPYAPQQQQSVEPMTGYYGNPYAQPRVNQRPGVSISETAEAEARSKNGSFSPFGTPQSQGNTPSAQNATPNQYQNSREFLFGASPAENYMKNLMFDPNSNANRRPSPELTQELGGTKGYDVKSSYTESYQNSVNEDTVTRPTKIVSDNTQNNSFDSYRSDRDSGYGAREEPTSFLSAPTQESERETFTDRTPVAETPTDTTDRSNILDTGRSEDGGYRRHDYMDLFSTANPNVFGRNEELDLGTRDSRDREEPVMEDRSREDDRNSFDRTDRTSFTEDRSSRDERDGLNLLDDEEEDEEINPYALRSDFEERSDTCFEEPTRDRDETTPRMGFGREETSREEETFTDRSSDRNSFIEPERTAPIQPVQPPKSVEEPKPTPPPPPKPRIIRPYVRVPLDDFDCRDVEPTSNQEEVEETKANIISTLEDFKVTGASIASVTFGPTVTRYNVTIPRNISPKKVVALDQSIAISLHSSGVNVYPNYEDGVVSIEVPNKDRQFVQLGCMLTGDTFVNAKSSSLMFTMGKDVANRKVYGDISKMIHLLVAGSSGSGKSVFLGSLIVSMIYKYSPEELRLILIDPKKTEFVLYNDLPHLMINEIITDVNKTIQSLNWAIGEMNRRYGLFEQMSRAGTYVVNLDQYNAQLEKNKRLPKIVIIIDELADLMLAAKKEMEDRIQNLTQKARAAGIHLIVATQRPSTDVITGVIKSNLPTRVAFYVATDVDSRVILDQTGAQKLLGKGDLLYTMPGLASPVRVQSAFISPEDSQKVVNFIKNNNEAYYDEEATNYINSRGGYGGDDASGGGGNKDEVDPMYIEALRYVILSGSASISMIQRKCSAGYNRAGKIIEWMEDMGYISPFDGAKARKVLITKEEFESKYGPLQ
ncbi:MAG: DNA translocase FtsK [Clostridia bacterium]|nr:DNA translocase FtsK [Clostridia bacterium]